MNRGVISIGTNSTRALVAALNGIPQVLLNRSIGTRIGEGLKERGHLDGEAMRRTLEAVREHAAAVHDLTNDVRVIATSALRRADNGEDFAREVSQLAGAPLEVISGEEEARRSFIGAVSALDAPPGEIFAVLDTGGGSSEYAVGSKAGPEMSTSCEIGAVRLTEAVPALAGDKGAIEDSAVEKGRKLAITATQQLERFPRADQLVLVGGSATTAVSVLRKERAPFSYVSFSRGDLQQLIALLRSLDLPSRKALPGMNPQRADILLAGLLIIDAVLERSHSPKIFISTNDLLLGTLLVSSRYSGNALPAKSDV